jgi:NADH-quinone oxidoreductase subunit K
VAEDGFRTGVRLALDWGAARIGVAACEAAVGLALVIAFHRHRQTTDADRADLLKQ